MSRSREDARRLRARAPSLLLTCLVGCHGGHSAIVDADGDPDGKPPIDAGACWPVDLTSTKGQIELGTGDDAFIAMPDEINIVYGSQGGFHIPARGRIQGLDPGDPVNVINPSNPRSWFRSYYVDGAQAGELTYPSSQCPFRLGYTPDPDLAGAYVNPTSIEVRFADGLGPADLFDKQFRVVVSVIDSTYGIATAEKVVIARAPIGWGAGADAGP